MTSTLIMMLKIPKQIMTNTFKFNLLKKKNYYTIASFKFQMLMELIINY